MSSKSVSGFAVPTAVLLAILFCSFICEAKDVKIAAFNIQIFGRTKAAKEHVMRIILQIIKRYDVIFIQEIRDISGDVIASLATALGSDYTLSYSGRLGRTSSKEQYLFLLRSNVVRLIDTYQYPNKEDTFERPPYAVQIEVDKIFRFSLVGAHLDPDVVPKELAAMATVHGAVKSRWFSDNIILFGDFNADCSYVSQSQLSGMTLRRKPFDWLIGDELDTTVSNTDCAYDRIIVTGSQLQKMLVNPGVYRFDQEFSLSQASAKEVSDHYPVQVTLRLTPIVPRDDSSQPSGAANVFDFSGWNYVALLVHDLYDYLQDEFY